MKNSIIAALCGFLVAAILFEVVLKERPARVAGALQQSTSSQEQKKAEPAESEPPASAPDDPSTSGNQIATESSQETESVLPALADIIDTGEFIKIPPSEMSLETHKWEGKVVETQAKCFYADLREFRCLVGTGARVDFAGFFPIEAQKSLEKNCDTMSKGMNSRACNTTIRFKYKGFSQMETGGWSGHITVVLAEDNIGKIIIVPQNKRKQK